MPSLLPSLALTNQGVKSGGSVPDRETMILRRDIAAFRPLQYARLILAAMPKFQLVGVAASRERQQLMTQADAQRRHLTIHCCTNGRDGLLCHLWIAGAVGDHDAIKIHADGIGERDHNPRER